MESLDAGAAAAQPVSSVMNRRLVRVGAGYFAGDVRRICSDARTSHALVMEGSELLGTLCACDLWDAAPEDRVSTIMSRHIISVVPVLTVAAVAKLMRSTGVGFLPVVERGVVLGVVTRGDLSRAGLPLERTGPVCSRCGAHHHVRPSVGPARDRFCRACRAQRGSAVTGHDSGESAAHVVSGATLT